uniref:PB1 domain-containing protein n=1 Tax=Seriola lalandi dorsalis TaxID=1841481 RepID=A0A3B4WZF7_SERLL
LINSFSSYLCVYLFVRLCSHVYLCVPSQFGAEFRRFSLDRSKPGRFDEFYGLLQHVHRIPNVELLVGYADVHGDLLPINNDDNYHKAISTASPLLRLFLQRKGKHRGSV